MPLHSYECTSCSHNFDAFVPLKELKEASIKCPKCSRPGKRIISLGHGGIFRDEPTWLNDEVRGALLDPSDKRPLETRTDYKKFLKENPHIIPVG